MTPKISFANLDVYVITALKSIQAAFIDNDRVHDNIYELNKNTKLLGGFSINNVNSWINAVNSYSNNIHIATHEPTGFQFEYDDTSLSFDNTTSVS